MFLGSNVIHWGTVARNDAPEPKVWPARGDSTPGTYMTALGMPSLSAKALPPTNNMSTTAMSGPNAYSQSKVGGESIHAGYESLYRQEAFHVIEWLCTANEAHLANQLLIDWSHDHVGT